MIIEDWNKAADLLLEGKIGVIPTDTIYGISCLANRKDLISKIYEIKGRDYSKPFIIIISSETQLGKFGIKLSKEENRVVNKYWPGPVSIILDVDSDLLQYLHRGSGTLAFRVPKHRQLASLLKKTGPLISTSANISGTGSPKTVGEAIIGLKDQVDFYLDKGYLDNPPSTVIRITDAKEVIIRGNRK